MPSFLLNYTWLLYIYSLRQAQYSSLFLIIMIVHDVITLPEFSDIGLGKISENIWQNVSDVIRRTKSTFTNYYCNWISQGPTGPMSGIPLYHSIDGCSLKC